MKTIAITLAVLLVLARSTADDLSGVWKVETVFTSTGLRSARVCTFTQEGNQLGGSCEGSSSPIRGEVDEAKVSWRLDADPDGRTQPVVFTGVVDTNCTTISGTWTAGPARDGRFTATRE